MPFKQGINFRATSGFRSDDGPDDYRFLSISFPNYPITTPQGVNVGYENRIGSTGSIGSADLHTDGDARLAGRHRVQSDAIFPFRIDLPVAGDYNIRFAGFENSAFDVYDGDTFATSLADGGSYIGSGSRKDAANAVHTRANWPDNNTHVEIAFGSTICRFLSVDTGSGSFNTYSHFYVEETEGESPDPIILTAVAQSNAESSATLNTGIALNASAESASVAQANLATSINLASTAAHKTISQAQLATAIALGSAAQSRHLTEGALLTQIQLASDSAQATLAQADLLTAITLGSAAESRTIAQADLSIGAPDMAGAAITQFNTQAALQTVIALHSAAAVRTSAEAVITIGAEMQGNARAACTSIAGLQTGIIIAGAAQSRHESAAALQTAIQLSGAVVAQTAAFGAIATSGSWLAGNGQAKSFTTGALSTSIDLTSAVFMRAAAAGDLSMSLVGLHGESESWLLAVAELSTAIRLDAAAMTTAVASAQLDGLPRSVPQSPRYTVTATRRNYCVAA